MSPVYGFSQAIATLIVPSVRIDRLGADILGSEGRN